MPGGGPSLTGDRCWKVSRRPYVKTCDGNYLVDTEELKSEFRQNFIAGLKRLWAKGELKLEGEWAHLNDAIAFDDWLKPLEAITWVAYIEPPPTAHSTPEHVVKYLTGGPISDRRFMSHDNGEVTFFARIGRKTGGDDETEPIALPGVEFVRRGSLHILPKGYTKTRRFGGFSNRHCKRYIAESRDLLISAGLTSNSSESAAATNDEREITDDAAAVDRRAVPRANPKCDASPCSQN